MQSPALYPLMPSLCTEDNVHHNGKLALHSPCNADIDYTCSYSTIDRPHHNVAPRHDNTAALRRKTLLTWAW